ncbi:DUF5694 domain-containing protein [Hyphococcus sp.]|uniref:DUF5694 domain-containing protein n=1 Tax=Hyphococcus sp. TaxID=2038636 RepID=UPI003CCB94D2
MIKQLLGAMLALTAACNAQEADSESAQSLASGPSAPAIQIMVVGTFHMTNPGQDVANAEIENMLTDQRQAEIAAVVNALAEFRPTVVAVERVTDAPSYVDANFNAFTPTALTENANERAQIGYRLASQASLDRVYGVDEQPSEGEPDYFPFDRLSAHASATGQGEKLENQVAEIRKIVSDFSALQKDHNVAELLIEQNTPETVALSKDFYYRTFEYDRGEDQPGAELQSYWFMRNAKIFSKLMQVTKPGDRIVVVYGAGHKFWLDHFAENTPGYVSVDPLPYLEKAAAQN